MTRVTGSGLGLVYQVGASSFVFVICSIGAHSSVSCGSDASTPVKFGLPGQPSPRLAVGTPKMTCTMVVASLASRRGGCMSVGDGFRRARPAKPKIVGESARRRGRDAIFALWWRGPGGLSPGEENGDL